MCIYMYIHLIQVCAVVLSLEVCGHSRYERGKLEDVVQKTFHHVVEPVCRVLVQ